MEKISDKSEAFDAAIALYTWLSHNHEGQFSDKYAAMSKIIGEYGLKNVPDIDIDNTDEDSDYETVVMIYHELTEDNWEEYFEDFCTFMDSEYDDE